MSKFNQNNYLNPLTFKHSLFNKKNFSFVWILINKIEFFLIKSNIQLINHSIFEKYLYLYIICHNYNKKFYYKNINILKFHLIITKFIIISRNIFKVFNVQSYLNYLIKILISNNKTLDIFLKTFFCKPFLKKNYKMYEFKFKSVQNNKILMVTLYNKFLTLLLMLNINSWSYLKKKIWCNNILTKNYFKNIEWLFKETFFKKKLVINHNKFLWSFNLNIRYILLILYLTEIFKNSFILLNFLMWIFEKQKIIFTLKILKIIKAIIKLINFFLLNNFIFIKGIKLYVNGKLTKLMRSKKYSFQLGNVNNQKHINFVSYSIKSLLIRAGIINYKLWVFY